MEGSRMFEKEMAQLWFNGNSPVIGKFQQETQ